MHLTIDSAASLQRRMAKKVIDYDVIDYNKTRNVCGVDVSYRGYTAYACAVVVDRHDFKIKRSVCIVTRVEQRYLPGLLFMREAEPIISVLGQLGNDYDILMVDGHGVLHPRRFGLACHIGMKINKPTIGIAKTLLCGEIAKDGSKAIILNEKTLGYVLNKSAKSIYVSVGHKISLGTAVRIVKGLSKYRIPEPLRLADINSRRIAAKH